MSLVRLAEKSWLLMEGLPVWLHFPRSSLNEWICSEGLLPTKEDDILKQRQSFLSIRWLSASSCSDSGSLTMETAIFVKSHLKKWLLSLPRGAKIQSILSNKIYCLVWQDLLSGPARGARHSCAHFAFGVGVLKMAPMANGSQVSFKLILSLRKLPPRMY